MVVVQASDDCSQAERDRCRLVECDVVRNLPVYRINLGYSTPFVMGWKTCLCSDIGWHEGVLLEGHLGVFEPPFEDADAFICQRAH